MLSAGAGPEGAADPQRAPSRQSVMHYAHCRRQVERQGVEKPRFGRDPADLGPPARDGFQYSRAFLWRPGRRRPCHRPIRRHRRHGDRGAVTRRAFALLVDQGAQACATSAPTSRRSTRRRGPHPPGRREQLVPRPRERVSVLPFSIRPMERVCPANAQSLARRRLARQGRARCHRGTRGGGGRLARRICFTRDAPLRRHADRVRVLQLSPRAASATRGFLATNAGHRNF